MKTCSSCNELKELELFHRCHTYKDGRMSICKECRNKSRRLSEAEKNLRGIEAKSARLIRKSLVCSVNSCESKAITMNLCSAHYHRYQRYGDPLGQPVSKPKLPKKKCIIDKCIRFSSAHGVCPAHYRRFQAHGDYLVHVPIIDGTQPIDGKHYRKMTIHGHPLAQKDGRVLQHRFVLYESIGPGWHRCHWCTRMITWELSHIDSKEALVVDHLNHNRTDNRLENLVPACSPCNSLRWAWKEVSNG